MGDSLFYERLQVCLDCYDGLSGAAPGTTRRKWVRAEQARREQQRGRDTRSRR